MTDPKPTPTPTQPAPSELDEDNLDNVVGGATAPSIDPIRKEQSKKAD